MAPQKPPAPPKDYAPHRIETKWAREWKNQDLYRFRLRKGVKTFVLDTPPPYPSGEFHMGNALNWMYMDFLARYKRMRGFEVMFPQGWDCHGLPTEVQVEKKYQIRKGDIPKAEFRRRCIALTRENIRNMKSQMQRLGFSIDWSLEYRTMDPAYWGRTQLSFIKLYRKGLIYRGHHPVDWCPRCQTAIAHAEVEYDERESVLNTLWFKDVRIATTRPELLCACVAVAVHPEDARYRGLVGKRLPVPLYNREVEVIADSKVDPGFGTGVVMICTFGDRTDVRWAQQYKLPVIQSIDETGHMTPAAGPYAGKAVGEAREAILADLEKQGLVAAREPLRQSVGICWRCKTPVEILPKAQWFLDVTSWRERILREAERVEWVPEAMKVRLRAWAEAMEWDWVISRQRIFATPIPVWYCRGCGEVRVAGEDQVPLADPSRAIPRESCAKCGKREWRPEEDVFDTWMDSSITILSHSRWPDTKSEWFRRTFPADVQPNGTDIIRTWDYYLLVRHLALLGRAPYKTVLINGMVVGPDGKKMSKSLGNYVTPPEPIRKHGADALRQWAALGGSMGSDIPYQEKDVVAGARFLQKMWNILRFAQPHIRRDPRAPLAPVDRWILHELAGLVSSATGAMEEYAYDRALKEIRGFAWEVLADEYLELVKWRLYGPDGPGKRAAQHTLWVVLDALARLLAPFTPFFAEEMFSVVRPGGGKGPASQSLPLSLRDRGSVHRQPWPRVEPSWRNPRAAEGGRVVQQVTAELRRVKAERGLPLNAPLGEVVVHAPRRLDVAEVSGAARSPVRWSPRPPEFHSRVQGVEPLPGAIGPLYRARSPRVAEAIKAMDPEEVARLVDAGQPIPVQVDGETLQVEPRCVRLQRETLLGDAAVEVRRVGEVTLVIPK
ncbi:MAG: valine--tRNA ligase [Euryarchaeota archaeon]|nr:valine--tRNA ligase [Euryarchaeota archaeon]